MTNYDAQKSKETKLREDIENVKLALRRLNPEPRSLLEKQQDSEEAQIKNRGLFDIKIDRRAVNQVLIACGFPEDSLHEVNIEFRSGTLADRNFWGQVAAGMRIDGENGEQVIEVYTSLPDSILVDNSGIEQALESTRTTNFAFKKEQIVISLLEELRHSIQAKLGLFDIGEGSFDAQSVEDLRNIDFEADAAEFTKALAKYLLPFVEIGRYDIEGVSEMYVDFNDIEGSFPGGLKNYLDTNLIAQVRETDPPGLYLSQRLKKIDFTSDDEVDGFVSTVFKILGNRKIGFVEARFLLNNLHSSLKTVGNFMKAHEIMQRISEIS